MPKVSELLKQTQDKYFNAGMDTGEQLAADCFAMAAFDCGVSRSTILQIAQSAMEHSKYYSNAVNTVHDKEADVYQKHMDEQLQKIYGDKFVPFAQRYEWIKPCKY